jgi:hypothetical protein
MFLLLSPGSSGAPHFHRPPAPRSGNRASDQETAVHVKHLDSRLASRKCGAISNDRQGSGRVRRSVIRTGMVAVATGLSLAAAARASSSGTAGASGNSKIVIGFRQAFSSNAWQKANDQAVATAARILTKEGKISSYKFVDANDTLRRLHRANGG